MLLARGAAITAAAVALVALTARAFLPDAHVLDWQRPRQPAVEVLLSGREGRDATGPSFAALARTAPRRVHALHATPLWLQLIETDRNIAVLRRCILAMRSDSAAGDGVVRSNVGGWHSASDLFDASGPTAALFTRSAGCAEALASLRTSVASSAARFGTAILTAHNRSLRVSRDVDTRAQVTIRDGWANINEGGDSNSAHTHGSAHISGVVYVDAGNSTGGRSCTLLQNPAPGILPATSTVVSGVDNGAVASAGTIQATEEDDICVSPVPGSVLLFPGWLPHAVLPHDGNKPRLSISFNADFVHSRKSSALSNISSSGGQTSEALASSDDDADIGLRNFDIDVGTSEHEAATDREFLEAARTMRSATGMSMAWLRRAWPSDVMIWAIPHLQTLGLGREGLFTPAQQRKQRQPTSSDGVAATIHGLACLLTARYSQQLISTRSMMIASGLKTASSGMQTELESCETWMIEYELVRMSAGARVLLGSGSRSTNNGTTESSAGDWTTTKNICGVIRLDAGVAPVDTLYEDKGKEDAEGETKGDSEPVAVASRGDVVVTSVDPRPEYGFKLGTADANTEFLHTLGLETRRVVGSRIPRVGMRASQNLHLGQGEAAILPCANQPVSDAWVTSDSAAPVLVATFVAKAQRVE